MELALYLPNFRNNITVKEIVDLTHLAEELEFESLWTLERVVVPKASDRGEMSSSFGRIPGLPTAMPIRSDANFLQGMPLIPYLAGITKKIRIGMSVIDTPFRAPATLAAEIATWDQLSGGRVNVAVGAGWMWEEFQAAGAAHVFEKRGKHVEETIEVMQGIWTNTTFEYHGEFADFPECGFGAKPVQKPHPPIYYGGGLNSKIMARRIAKYNLNGWMGIFDTPQSIADGCATLDQKLKETDGAPKIEDLEIATMVFFDITKDKVDQSDRGKLTPTMMGTEQQIIDNLKRFQDAGLTKMLLWPPFDGEPPFNGPPTSKTITDLRRLKEDIFPRVS